MSWMSLLTVNVNVACVEACGARLVFSLFQVIVMWLGASAGLQLLRVHCKVAERVPKFLI